jgi:hypothetical protein
MIRSSISSFLAQITPEDLFHRSFTGMRQLLKVRDPNTGCTQTCEAHPPSARFGAL